MMSAKILATRQNVALTCPLDPQTFWVPTVHWQSRQRTAKERSMSVHLLTIGGGDHNVPKAPTERVPMNAVISHSDTRGRGSSFARAQ
jgi:poly(3-hydroxybutyrate) depolymerase